MNKLSLKWKMFRVLCVLQLVLVAIQIILSFSGLFYTNGFKYHILYITAFCLVFLFVYQALSLLNYNYPDTPLTVKQKRNFNWLFLINFLLIAVLFSKVLNLWWIIPLMLDNESVTLYNGFGLLMHFLMAAGTFVLHLLFLAGIYNLRRLIYKNTLDSWYRQFDDGKGE